VAEARILLVDDDLSVLSGLTRALQRERYDVIPASDGETGLRLAGTERPDLVVLDVVLPGIDGLSVCEQIRASAAVPILMLTARDSVIDRVTGLEKGADDYLAKPFSVEELVARVRAMLRRTPPASQEELGYAGISANLRTRTAARDGQPLALTQREFELLVSLLRHPEEALRREQLCRMVWGHELDAGSNFVDVTVGRLRQKLEAEDRRRLIQAIRGFGYVLRAG
jgi:DNA-binding response OmpR family regulator